MTERKMPKLPQARLYLGAAQWGLDELVKCKHLGRAFRFYLIGILASLRAVQHALRNHDYYLSDAHRQAVDAWWTPETLAAPELVFIKTARDQMLKGGAFDAYAIRSESGIGEGSNYTVTDDEYDLAYYVGDERRELLPELRNAVAWCERELMSIEAKVPEVPYPD